MASGDVVLSERFTQVQLSFVKGKPASRESPVSLHAAECGDELLDLYYTAGAPEEPRTCVSWPNLVRQCPGRRPLYDAFLRMLHLVRHVAPAGCRHGAHSLRIGAHTVQVPLGIPLEACMARFE